MKKIAIVSRTFWPVNPAIGEALLLLAESLSNSNKAIVITQVHKNFQAQLKDERRGEKVNFSTIASLTDSSSHLVLRIIELLLFTVFVFFSLCWQRPDKVYVATNPPIFTPLAVRWYCWLFRKKYIYHLQDIHPEITSIVTGKSNFITKALLAIDSKTVRNASSVITLTEQMQSYLNKRTDKELPIALLDNPSVQNKKLKTQSTLQRTKGFVYCGNAGRLQRIPLLLEAIEKHLEQGGSLPFVFAGGGVYRKNIEELASKFEQVTYLGILPADKAADLLHNYTFGLMPIDDEVTNYAFPSKSSSYVFSGCQVIAICGKDTSVANWVNTNKLGFVVEPNIVSLTDLFSYLENSELDKLNISNELLNNLTPKTHAENLEKIIALI